MSRPKEAVPQEEVDRARQAISHLVSFRAFCQALNICEETGWRWRRAGKLQVTKIGNRVFVDMRSAPTAATGEAA